MISYWNYRLEKAELLQCLKSHRVRTLMDSQYVKGSETLLKSARQCFSDIFWSLSEKISRFNTFLEISEIVRLFVSILTPDNKYILSVKRMFNATNPNAVIEKPRKLFWIVFCISRIYMKFWMLSKNSWA